MPIDRTAKLEELKVHLAAIATISKDLKRDRELLAEDDGWTVPGSEFLDLGLDTSPVSEGELLAWLDDNDHAKRSVLEREQLMKTLKSVSEAAVKLAPLLLVL